MNTLLRNDHTPQADANRATADGQLNAGAYITPLAGEPEQRELRLGFIPLSDCAPLVVARHKGCFERQGLDVTLTREPSWSAIRDKLACGRLDAAHMLAAIPLAATLGITGLPCPMITGMSLDLNGNAITVSNKLHAQMTAVDPEAMRRRPITAEPLRKVIEFNAAAGREPLTFASVFPFSSHHYELRYWLAAAGIDPDRDVRLIVVPPPGMVTALSRGEIDGYCVGEPWNSVAVERGVGRVLIAKHELWSNSPEKVLGVRADWALRHPNTHRALIRALLEACAWLDHPDNREEAAQLVAQPGYVDASPSAVAAALTGQFRYGPGEPTTNTPDFFVFHRHAANFPWRSHAMWTLTQMIRWGQLDPRVDMEQIAREVYRPEVYRAAAQDLALPCPAVDYKCEGTHAQPWTLSGTPPVALGADTFFDDSAFDPRRPMAYLADFDVTRTAEADGLFMTR
ncbi:CmpA/NrtA family ABC transporter substrate-binding protein [Phycisphaerales bacterium AB-hyl4]|uniref:CmpA/NrtA family ABC transporter substrate-binding protein n=1 Tax=Natronomicrosphaera hydrolytica TaxID=3242702 RepID=A0ABV4U9U2_9BACT